MCIYKSITRDVRSLMSLGLSWNTAKVKKIKCNPKLSSGFRDEPSLLKHVGHYLVDIETRLLN